MKKNVRYYSFDGTQYACTVVDKETGEVVAAIDLENSDDIINQTFTLSTTIISEQQPNAPVSTAVDNFSYCKDFRGNGLYFRQFLKPQEQVLLRFLADYISYNDCVLRYQGNTQGRILSVIELASLYQMELTSFRRTLNALRTKQCIIYHAKNTIHDRNNVLISEKCITVNPYIYSRGNGVTQEIIDLYKGTMWADLNRGYKREW